MKLFYAEDKPDLEEMKESATKMYGASNPTVIQGFAGAFMFCIPDVYLTNRLAEAVDGRPEREEFLRECIVRFYQQDYGEVSESTDQNNGELRWLCGSSYNMIAVYPSDFGKLRLHTGRDKSYFGFDEERACPIEGEEGPENP